MESAVRWGEGERESEKGERETVVHSSETGKVAEVDGWGHSEAREYCSGLRTPEGEMHLTHLLLLLCVSVEPFECTEAPIRGTCGRIPPG